MLSIMLKQLMPDLDMDKLKEEAGNMGKRFDNLCNTCQAIDKKLDTVIAYIQTNQGGIDNDRSGGN